MAVWQKYISMMPEDQNRQPTGVYEWDDQNGFGRMIHVGDIVVIPVERKLKSKPYDFQRVLTRGVVYLQHGTFKIDIDNEHSTWLCHPIGNEIAERTVNADWPRHLSNYGVDRHKENLPHFPKGCGGFWRQIHILGNIAENPELLVR